MPTKVEKKIMKDGSKLSKALELLMHDIVYASIYNKLINDLAKSKSKYSNVYNQSNTFWFLVFESIKESRMIRLCRICDTQTNSISLGNLLQAIKGCKDVFSKEEFRKRLKDNPFVDSLSEYNREIITSELENEINEFNENQTVQRIRKWRNNYIAHKGINEGLNDFPILLKNELSFEDISKFIKYSHGLIDKYLHTLIAVSWSDKIVGDDDYNSLLKFASMGLDKYKMDIGLEIEENNNEHS